MNILLLNKISILWIFVFLLSCKITISLQTNQKRLTGFSISFNILTHWIPYCFILLPHNSYLLYTLNYSGHFSLKSLSNYIISRCSGIWQIQNFNVSMSSVQ